MTPLSDILSELRQEYLESLPGRAQRLRQAQHQGDGSSLASELHKLKGTGTTYGFESLSDLGARLEKKLACDGQLDDELVEALSRLLEDLSQKTVDGEEFTVVEHQDYKQLIQKTAAPA